MQNHGFEFRRSLIFFQAFFLQFIRVKLICENFSFTKYVSQACPIRGEASESGLF